jgi:SAM-dependent methyltransferase
MPGESTWAGEVHHICFNDECSYFVDSWDALEKQGIEKTGYRCRVDCRGYASPAPVWSDHALKECVLKPDLEDWRSLQQFSEEDLAADDGTPDSEFYRSPRFVDHLDSTALSLVRRLYGRLIPGRSRILDLMAGPASHLDEVDRPRAITALGLNEEELKANERATSYVIHDLNADPCLPFGDDEFDTVVNTVSVDYLTRPLEVFREVARVLKPGGLYIVVFSNRMFPPKAIHMWKRLTERQRVDLVRRYFTLSELFRIEGYYESTGNPRPKDDKYAHLGIPSDPVYAVWGTPLK